MNKNNNLHKAKKSKNDEFYTRLEDIEAELSHYPVEYFRNKVIYCPCDVGVEGLDIPKSNFIKYFEDNKDRLGYKKLIHTSLQEGFDYRSEYCQKLFKEADVVVTNPPFSLFRDFVACLESHELKYIILGDKNAITYKEIFPLIRDNKLWLGHSVHSGERYFYVPEGNHISKKLSKGIGVRWFTNLDVTQRHEQLILIKQYDPNNYPKYDNYDAINVDKVKDIPVDYYGVMGIPITFLDKYNPEQFEIVAFRKGDDGKDLVFTRDEEREFNRTFVSLYDIDSRDDKKYRRQNQWETYLCENNNQTEIEPIDLFYPMSMAIGGCMNSPKDTMINGEKKYARILIRKKAEI